MKTRAFLLGLALVLVLVLSTFAWQRRAERTTAPATARFTVVGVVTAPAVGRQVSVAHDDIPGLMPAMTMPFTMGTGVDVGTLRPGDRVRFVLEVGEARSEAHSLEVTGRDETMAAAAREADRSGARTSRLRRGDLVPAFALRDQSDAPFTEAALGGRFTVATFIFTRCPLPEFCPLMVQRLRALQTTLRETPALDARTRLLSITLDPAFDTPEVLHAYGTTMGADFTRWSFVTGSAEAIDGVAKAFAVYTERNGAALDHTLATALIGPDGRVVEIWRGNGWKEEDVLAALRAESGT